MKTKAIIFDLDGTLINSLLDIAAVVNRVRKLYEYPPLPVEQVRSSIGKGIEFLVKGCFPEVDPDRIPEILIKHRQYYLEHPHVEGTLYEGVLETLQKIKGLNNLKIGIATNKPKPVAILTLKHYLPDFTFDAVFGPEDVSKKKPDPAHLLETLAYLGVAPEDALFCGDDPVDLKCASAAGVFFLGAGWGFGGVKANNSHHLTKFEQIFPWVLKLLV